MIGSSVYNTPISEIKPTGLQIRTLFKLNLLERYCVLNKGHYINYIKFEKDFN